MQTNDPNLTKQLREAEHKEVKPNFDKPIDEDASHETLERETEVNKGTDTFESDVMDSKHVNDGDNPARQPDRRDQEGEPFDGGVNENFSPHYDRSEPKSEEINEYNRYATVDNAQTRVLTETEQEDK